MINGATVNILSPFITHRIKTMDEVLKEKLRNGVVDVEFVKKDGTLRKMRCTINHEFMPPHVVEEEKQKLKENKQRKVSLEAQPVYDLEAQGWRSFRWDSVKTYTQLHTE